MINVTCTPLFRESFELLSLVFREQESIHRLIALITLGQNGTTSKGIVIRKCCLVYF